MEGFIVPADDVAFSKASKICRSERLQDVVRHGCFMLLIGTWMKRVLIMRYASRKLFVSMNQIRHNGYVEANC